MLKTEDSEWNTGFGDPKYPEILRKASSADPTKYPLVELELVMRELFQEDKLDSVIIASEKLKNFDSREVNFLRLNCYLFYLQCWRDKLLLTLAGNIREHH